MNGPKSSNEDCTKCNGLGYVVNNTCPRCGGTGVMQEMGQLHCWSCGASFNQTTSRCTTCQGTGKVETVHPCSHEVDEPHYFCVEHDRTIVAEYH